MSLSKFTIMIVRQLLVLLAEITIWFDFDLNNAYWTIIIIIIIFFWRPYAIFIYMYRISMGNVVFKHLQLAFSIVLSLLAA